MRSVPKNPHGMGVLAPLLKSVGERAGMVRCSNPTARPGYTRRTRCHAPTCDDVLLLMLSGPGPQRPVPPPAPARAAAMLDTSGSATSSPCRQVPARCCGLQFGQSSSANTRRLSDLGGRLAPRQFPQNLPPTALVRFSRCSGASLELIPSRCGGRRMRLDILLYYNTLTRSGMTVLC